MICKHFIYFLVKEGNDVFGFTAPWATLSLSSHSQAGN